MTAHARAHHACADPTDTGFAGGDVDHGKAILTMLMEERCTNYSLFIIVFVIIIYILRRRFALFLQNSGVFSSFGFGFCILYGDFVPPLVAEIEKIIKYLLWF